MADVLVHFTVLSRKDFANFHVRCKFCEAEFHASKPRLMNHLAQQQHCGIKPCPHVPPEVKDAMSESTNKKRKQSSPSTSTSSLPSTASSPTQLSLPAAFQADHRKEADEKWGDFCYAEGIPFTKFASSWLQEAIKATIVAGLTYKIPNPKQLSGALLTKKVEKVKDKLQKTVFRNVATTGTCGTHFSEFRFHSIYFFWCRSFFDH
jgi:hypothetical protein